MEGLSGMLKEVVSKGFFRGIRVGHNGPTLSHFLYADDAVFLGEWNMTNAVNLKRILRVFHAVSGLKVNLNKCRVFGTKVDDGEVWGIARILHSWDKVTAPVGKGGLGLGSLSVANLALLAKGWWRFKQEKNGLWRKVVWAIHHTKTGESPLKDRFPLLFKLERIKGCKVGDRLVIFERELCGVWSWHRKLVSADKINEFRQLLILCSGVNVGYGIDRLIWALDGSNDFSVNSIKKCVGEWCYPDTTWVFGWNNWIPKKVCVLAWRVGLECVASLAELAKRNIVFELVLCLLCGEVDETVVHIFTSCGFAQDVWQILAL
ncbi:uncharacterized protein LOC143541437 [Bidens hawaiensis]|uniref:uncharacterized protein LOC143541437 n=1 Tax=Bidens hawaiensis TaxID=980011 RepID=UPI00404ACECE